MTPNIDSIAVAFTPAGGWVEWPSAILAGCTDQIPNDAPEIDGFWQTIKVVR